jgi:NADH-quinone oxidoreductase subunit N
MNLYKLDLFYMLPELYFGLMIILIFNFGLYYEEKKASPELCIQSQLIEFWLLCFLLKSIDKNIFVMLNSYVLDSWSTILKIIMLILGFFYFFFLRNVSFEFITLIMIFKFSSFFLLSAYNFLIFYLALELGAFVLYLLVASRKEDIFSTEGALKYFVLGSFSSILVVLGISFIYGLVGSLDFTDVLMFGSGLEWETGKIYMSVSIFFILVGLCFKLGLAPFHFWVADVYQGSSWIVLLFLVVFSKIGIFGILVRLIYEVFIFDFETISLFFFFLGLFSLFIGSLGALSQTNLKRLVGYSGIGHMGFIIFGLSTGTGLGLLSSLFYFVFYLILNMGWLLILKKAKVENLEDLKGISKWLGGYLTLTMFSVAGVPPLGGFFMKLYLFFSLVQLSLWLALFLLILSSMVAAYYYLRLIQMVNFSKITIRKELKIESVEGYVLITLIYMNVFFIFFQNYLLIFLLNQ